jgi:hypothetical protein
MHSASIDLPVRAIDLNCTKPHSLYSTTLSLVQKVKVKVKVEQATKAHKGSRVISLLFL